ELQVGNSLPQTRLEPKRSNELADNRIGLYFHGLWNLDLNEILQHEILDLGATRVKGAVNELDWNLVDWSRPEMPIDPRHDAWFASLADNGVKVTYILSFWDKANHPNGAGLGSPRFRTEEEITRYLDFVRYIVGHFRGRGVQYYELWNEPDWPDNIQWIEPADYVAVAKRAIPVIREEDPEARIGMMDAQAREYLYTLLRSDIMPLVDVVTWHPMYGVSPEYQSEYYYQYPAIVEEIKSLASGHGFRGEYAATELVYRSPTCTWCNPNDVLYSDVTSAKYYLRGIMLHLGMDVTVGLAGMSKLYPVTFPAVRNLCTVMAGAQAVPLPIDVESQATPLRVYAFSLADGGRLIALWADVAAVDDDPGTGANLRIGGHAGWQAEAIDPLSGVVQPLVTRDEGEDLLIDGLLVRDYPIVLRLRR
ncbi:MAG: hypothetical protein QME94_16350, partial [Anaerolineae bacterium]|nr:hypothetical protein [Anaerolineae bacterium]